MLCDDNNFFFILDFPEQCEFFVMAFIRGLICFDRFSLSLSDIFNSQNTLIVSESWITNILDSWKHRAMQISFKDVGILLTAWKGFHQQR